MDRKGVRIGLLSFRIRMWRGLICGLALLCACTPMASRQVTGVTSARVTGVSREYRPALGGQTIMPPQRVADVTTLWMPLPPRNRKGANVVPPRYTILPSAPVRVQDWVPPSEIEVMRSYLQRLTTSHAPVTRRVLERATEWWPMIQEVMARYNLPPELACLPLVESAFDPQTVSTAGAAGLWQFMPNTARHYGLTVTASLDERFDPRKSTEAAAQYLTWLYGYFRDWPLVLAAYNCGEGAISGFLRRYDVTTLEELTLQGRGVVPAETLGYVPRFVAAVSVMALSGELGLHSRNLLSMQTSRGHEQEESRTLAPENKRTLHPVTPHTEETPLSPVSRNTFNSPMRRIPENSTHSRRSAPPPAMRRIAP